jgi:hypothetical protein
MFFSLMFVVLAVLSMGLALPVVLEYLQTGLVRRFPTAGLSAAVMLLAFLSMACGLVLDTVTHSRRELKRLAYLEIPAPKWPAPHVAQTVPGGLPMPSPGGRVAAPGPAQNDPAGARLPQTPVAVS